jgi:hypothetical protein
LIETRKAVTDGWLNVAAALDIQGKTTLANEVRDFARHLPGVLTDRELVAVALAQPLQQDTQKKTPKNT